MKGLKILGDVKCKKTNYEFDILRFEKGIVTNLSSII